MWSSRTSTFSQLRKTVVLVLGSVMYVDVLYVEVLMFTLMVYT